MAQFDKKALVFMLIITSWLTISHCSKKPVGVARKEDIPFIKCQVCEVMAKELYRQVQAKQAQISPKKVSEYDIIEMSENICNLKKQEADWILKIDIVEQGDRLELVEQESEGQCGSKCKTVERACQEVMGYYDTDVAEYLYKNKPKVESLVSYLCKDLSASCTRKPPPVPKDRVPGEPFIPKSEKEAEMERLMKSMEGMPGAPNMQMYSRDDLMNQNFGNEDADEEGEDDEDQLPSSLKNAFRQKETKNVDWKQTITKGILDAGAAVKTNVDRASFRLQKWWKAKKAALTKKDSSVKSEL
ncbi:hypothetical protein Leryth_023374 [Lithospermum erythrorhizon]|nr:hypothetical protein Leryth_023374 [Lithospermum erythrorhizon]